jgi:hypothetical protein
VHFWLCSSAHRVCTGADTHTYAGDQRHHGGHDTAKGCTDPDLDPRTDDSNADARPKPGTHGGDAGTSHDPSAHDDYADAGLDADTSTIDGAAGAERHGDDRVKLCMKRRILISRSKEASKPAIASKRQGRERNEHPALLTGCRWQTCQPNWKPSAPGQPLETRWSGPARAW